MGKILPVTDKLWNQIYYPIRDHFLEKQEAVLVSDKILYLENCFAGMGIILHRADPDSKWSHVEFLDDMDFVELVLRWS